MDEWIRRIRGTIGHDLMFINSAGGWIEDEQRRVLLQKRSRSQAHWGFPGGVMQLGESAEEAAIREIREETGLIVTPVGLIGVYTKSFETCANGDQCQNVTVFFRMKPVGGALRVDGKETFDLRFLAPAEMPPLYSDQHRQMKLDAETDGPAIFR